MRSLKAAHVLSSTRAKRARERACAPHVRAGIHMAFGVVAAVLRGVGVLFARQSLCVSLSVAVAVALGWCVLFWCVVEDNQIDKLS